MEKDESINKFTSLYHDNRELLGRNAPEFLGTIRDAAMEQFSAAGFPGKKDEQYKYTFLEPYFNNGYVKLLEPKAISFNVTDLFHCDVPALDTHMVILLNGFYYNQPNSLKTLSGGIVVGSMQAAYKAYPELVKKNLSRIAPEADSLVSLNTALFGDGIFIYAPKGAVPDKPIQVVNLLLSDEELMVQHRNLIILDENSRLDVVVCDHSLSAHKFLTNSVTEINVGEGAVLDYFKVQNEHNDSVQVSHTFVHQQASSNTQLATVTLHGGMVRNNLNVKLDGEGSNCNAYGLFFTDETQHVDNSVFINHAKPHCTSNQLFKGILDDQSSGVFSGKILVEPNAQKTMAYQKNGNLLLTDEAKMDARPQLEIYADDVKCSHGSTVGQLDEDSLFYLRARGIEESEARLMLMYAFAHEILGNIRIEALRSRMAELMDKRLRGELSRCNSCEIQCG